jgi:hypothetical protein
MKLTSQPTVPVTGTAPDQMVGSHQTPVVEASTTK